MRQSPLEEKSIVELRSLAQTLGAKFTFSDNKSVLIKSIRAVSEASAPRALPFVNPTGPTAATPLDVRAQQAIVDALDEYCKKGLHLSFPSPNTWHMERGIKKDSGNTAMPVKDIVVCARNLMA